MADRYQNYSNQSGKSRKRQDWRNEDPTRGSNYRAEEARYSTEDDYGYGSHERGDEQYGGSRDTGGQSGSTGRYAGYGDVGQGDYSGEYSGSGDYSGRRAGASGQGNYGQTGYGQGGYGQSGYGQGGYGQSGYGRGGYGQGRSDYDESRGRYSQGTFGTERGWREPFGEGQQYPSREEYAGSSSESGYGGRGVGPHRGKGPKGYQRSDERIKELLCERLHEDPDIDPSEVTINVQGGKITLDGTVDSRHTKNAIEDIAEQFGVQDVQNNLRVQRQGQSVTESSGRTASGMGTGRSATSNDDSTAKTKQH